MYNALLSQGTSGESYMEVYEAKTYQEFLNDCLEKGTAYRPKSTKKSLAEHIKCHSTFVSHVLAEKAHFNNEQAIRFSEFYGLSPDETDYFIDLINHDRAGDVKTKNFFAKRIARHRTRWLKLSHRIKTEDRLSPEQEDRYFENPLLQAVHLATLLPNTNNATAIAKRLQITARLVENALDTLREMGLLEVSDDNIAPRNRLLHLDKASPVYKRYHANWRLKIINDAAVANQGEGVHYTSIFTLSREQVDRFKQLVLTHIEDSRELVIDSSPEQMFAYALDFYPLTD